MIASEGLKSPAVNQMLCFSHDLAARYAEGENDPQGHVKKRYYQGQKYMSQIEDYTTDIMKSLFKADWADVRLVSGTHANLATFKGLSLASKNNKMVVTPLSCGAHISHDYTGLAGNVLGLENINHVYNIDEFNIDPDKSAYVIRAAKPGIVTFGGSLFLFPHPITRVKSCLRRSRRIHSLRRISRFGFNCRRRIPRPTARRRRLHNLFNPQNFPRSPRRRHHGKPNQPSAGESSEKNPIRHFPT